MNKKKKQVISKKFVIIIIVILLVLSVVLVFFQTINILAKRKIENNYKKINVPGSFTYQKKHWTPESLDVTEYMTYYYTFDGSQKNAVDAFNLAASKAGFRLGKFGTTGQDTDFVNCPTRIQMHFIEPSSNPHYYGIQLPNVGKANILIDVYDYGKNCLNE